MKIRLKIIERARIEMLPLIDVIFLLLVFFIYAMLSMSVHRGIPILLPQAASASIENTQLTNVDIDRNGNIYVDKILIPELDFEQFLAGLKARDPGVSIQVAADGRVSYERVLAVLDTVRLAEIKKVSLMTRWKKEEIRP
jgi:biopolymer transport protein ExbD